MCASRAACAPLVFQNMQYLSVDTVTTYFVSSSTSLYAT